MIRRRRLKTELFFVILFAVVSGGFLYSRIKLDPVKGTKEVNSNLPKKSLLSVENTPNSSSSEVYLERSTSTRKYVTKSMAELGKMDEINRHFLLLNWMPGSGAEMLVFLLEKLQGINSFKHVRLKGKQFGNMSATQQFSLINEMNDIRRDLAVPLSFDRTVHIVNFTSFDKQSPTYVNLIRDPVSKIISQTTWKKTVDDSSRCLLDNERNCNFKVDANGFAVSWFCGHDPRCSSDNDWALNTAKENVKRFYPVIGILEDVNTTFKVLENRLPQFFRGANEVFNSTLFDIFKHRKDPLIPETARRKLQKPLEKEIEFYNWIKERLVEQAANITI